MLAGPTLPAIGGAEDVGAASDDPAIVLGDEVDSIEVLWGPGGKGVEWHPICASVGVAILIIGVEEGAAISNDPRDVVAHQGDVVELSVGCSSNMCRGSWCSWSCDGQEPPGIALSPDLGGITWTSRDAVQVVDVGVVHC